MTEETTTKTTQKPRIRRDYELIESLVGPSASVLDLGCGDGRLLEELAKQKSVQGRGIEISEDGVHACISRGVPVYHGDIVEGLSMYGDKFVDYVILSQTLQETSSPALVIREMLRVAKKAIVSIPNYGHWFNRLYILMTGRMPKTKLLPYEWYNAPTLHLLSIKDFRNFCRANGIHIARELFLSTSYRPVPRVLGNLLAGLGIFVIEEGNAYVPREEPPSARLGQ